MKKKYLSVAAILLAVILIVEIGFLVKLKTADDQPSDTKGEQTADQTVDSGSSQESDVPKDTEGDDSQQNAEKPASTDGAGVDMTQPGTTGSTAPAGTSGNEAAGNTTAPTETEETRPGGLEEDELPPIPV